MVESSKIIEMGHLYIYIYNKTYLILFNVIYIFNYVLSNGDFPVRKLLDYKSQWMGFGKQIQDTHIFHGNNHGFRYCRFYLNPFTKAKWASPSGDISPGTAFTKVQVVHLVAGCGPKQLQHV